MDFTVWSMLNGKERDETDWKTLFAQADRRFKHEKTIILPDRKMALFDFVWDFDSSQS